MICLERCGCGRESHRLAGQSELFGAKAVEANRLGNSVQGSVVAPLARNVVSPNGEIELLLDSRTTEFGSS
jgi:hypothetical protein